MAITKQKEDFSKLICRGVDPIEAAIKSGYSKKSARRSSERLLRDKDVIALCDTIKGVKIDILKKRGVIAPTPLGVVTKEIAKDLGFDDMIISYERLLKELFLIGTFDPGELFGQDGQLLTMAQMPKHVRHGISEIDVRTGPNNQIFTKIKLHGKVAAIDKLLSHLEPPLPEKLEYTEEERKKKIKDLKEKLGYDIG